MADLVELPAGLKVRRLDLSGCTGLARLPEGLEVRHLDVSGCTGLTGLPAGLRCYEVVASGSGLRSLPADLRVEFAARPPRLHRPGRAPGRAQGRLAGAPGLHGAGRAAGGARRQLPGPPGLCPAGDLARRGDDPDRPARPGRVPAAHLAARRAGPPGPARRLGLHWASRSCPRGSQVGSWIEIANTGITSLPDSLAGVNLRWRGVPIDERIAFRPESIDVRRGPRGGERRAAAGPARTDRPRPLHGRGRGPGARRGPRPGRRPAPAPRPDARATRTWSA